MSETRVGFEAKALPEGLRLATYFPAVRRGARKSPECIPAMTQRTFTCQWTSEMLAGRCSKPDFNSRVIHPIALEAVPYNRRCAAALSIGRSCIMNRFSSGEFHRSMPVRTRKWSRRGGAAGRCSKRGDLHRAHSTDHLSQLFELSSAGRGWAVLLVHLRRCAKKAKLIQSVTESRAHAAVASGAGPR